MPDPVTAAEPAAAAFAVRQRVAEARTVLLDYERTAQLYLRMKEPGPMSWGRHADKLATRLRALLDSIDDCERIVAADPPTPPEVSYALDTE